MCGKEDSKQVGNPCSPGFMSRFWGTFSSHNTNACQVSSTEQKRVSVMLAVATARSILRPWVIVEDVEIAVSQERLEA
jgi:hypothetical protein